jgi:boron transporter
MILFTSSLLPALAYTLDMYRRTGEFFGVNEGLFSSALAAMVFSILGTQPLTIVGVTGLISLFNFTIYNIIEIYDVSIYPQFICWTAIWAAIFHWAVAIFNWCDYMRYVTDFSSESFGMYVGIIYISGSTLPLSVHATSPNIHAYKLSSQGC